LISGIEAHGSPPATAACNQQPTINNQQSTTNKAGGFRVQFHQTVLENGMHVVAEVNDQAHSVAAGFFVKTGSRDETKQEAGLSHFLEHMVFKGTPRRDALAVNRDFDRVGAKHNAQTSEEDTVYHVTCLPEYLPRSLEVLADILRPSLREEDFKTEKEVIIEEIKMYLDNPMSVAYEAAKSLHFGSHPLGHSVLGTVESISAMQPGQMKDYFERRYGPQNVVLAFAGKAPWEQLRALAEERCGTWRGGAATREAVRAKGSGKFEAIARAEDNQETVIAVADAPELESADRYAAQLLATILGDHTGSRLYWALIDPGYADTVDLTYQDYNRTGAFYTFLSCEPEETQENLERIATVFRDAMSKGLTEEELTQAKNKVLARTVLRSERPMGRLMSLGFHWAYRRQYLPVEQELEAFSSVTVGDLKRILADWPLLPMTIASVGPTTDVRPPG
jgi:predicted Zn-dependent peptidase